jgi:hypothetical protein
MVHCREGREAILLVFVSFSHEMRSGADVDLCPSQHTEGKESPRPGR